VTGRVFTKTYADPAACYIAAANHNWLSNLGIRLPALLAERSHELTFTFIKGRHAEPRDLIPLAAHLGQIHALVYHAQLHHAHLDRPYRAPNGHHIPDFLEPRARLIEQRHRSSPAADPRSDIAQIKRLMRQATSGPAAFYKDTNPRNIIVTTDSPIMVDFDDLTLAPFGYDLAKLIVTLAMTYGPQSQISPALAAYNSAVENITHVSMRDLTIWTEIHHILTSPYLGTNGYTNTWK
jgi:Ser/Thr protein kinase RdoA (MazF antagonist)